MEAAGVADAGTPVEPAATSSSLSLLDVPGLVETHIGNITMVQPTKRPSLTLQLDAIHQKYLPDKVSPRGPSPVAGSSPVAAPATAAKLVHDRVRSRSRSVTHKEPGLAVLAHAIIALLNSGTTATDAPTVRRNSVSEAASPAFAAARLTELQQELNGEVPAELKTLLTSPDARIQQEGVVHLLRIATLRVSKAVQEKLDNIWDAAARGEQRLSHDAFCTALRLIYVNFVPALLGDAKFLESRWLQLADDATVGVSRDAFEDELFVLARRWTGPETDELLLIMFLNDLEATVVPLLGQPYACESPISKQREFQRRVLELWLQRLSSSLALTAAALDDDRRAQIAELAGTCGSWQRLMTSLRDPASRSTGGLLSKLSAPGQDVVAPTTTTPRSSISSSQSESRRSSVGSSASSVLPPHRPLTDSTHEPSPHVARLVATPPPTLVSAPGEPPAASVAVALVPAHAPATGTATPLGPTLKSPTDTAVAIPTATPTATPTASSHGRRYRVPALLTSPPSPKDVPTVQITKFTELAPPTVQTPKPTELATTSTPVLPPLHVVIPPATDFESFGRQDRNHKPATPTPSTRVRRASIAATTASPVATPTPSHRRRRSVHDQDSPSVVPSPPGTGSPAPAQRPAHGQRKISVAATPKPQIT